MGRMDYTVALIVTSIGCTVIGIVILIIMFYQIKKVKAELLQLVERQLLCGESVPLDVLNDNKPMRSKSRDLACEEGAAVSDYNDSRQRPTNFFEHGTGTVDVMNVLGNDDFLDSNEMDSGYFVAHPVKKYNVKTHQDITTDAMPIEYVKLNLNEREVLEQHIDGNRSVSSEPTVPPRESYVKINDIYQETNSDYDECGGSVVSEVHRGTVQTTKLYARATKPNTNEAQQNIVDRNKTYVNQVQRDINNGENITYHECRGSVDSEVHHGTVQTTKLYARATKSNTNEAQ